MDMDLAAFREPANELRPKACWLWNENLDTDWLLWQLGQLRDKGLGGCIIQARPGTVSLANAPGWEASVEACKANVETGDFLIDLDSPQAGAINMPGIPSWRHGSGGAWVAECPGGQGWADTLAHLKHAVDTAAVFGANRLVFRDMQASLAGHGNHTPSLFFQAPHWIYFRELSDYAGRLCTAMELGPPEGAVALYTPSQWLASPAQAAVFVAGFNSLVETLSNLSLSWILVDDGQVQDLEWSENSLVCRGVHCQGIVVPPCESIPAGTAEALDRLSSHTPVLHVGDASAEILDEAGNASGQWNPADSVVSMKASEGDRMLEALGQPSRPFEFVGPLHGIRHIHRTDGSTHHLFFSNPGLSPISTQLKLQLDGRPRWLDLETGSPSPCGFSGEGNLLLHLPAMGSCLLEVGPTAGEGEDPSQPLALESSEPLCEGLWHFTPFNGNFVALRRWHLSIKSQHNKTELRYTTEFAMPDSIPNPRMIMKRGMGEEDGEHVLLNGQPVTQEMDWEIDPAFRVLDLDGMCPGGAYRLEIIRTLRQGDAVRGLEDPVWIAGDFLLEQEGGLPRLCPMRGIEAGPWETQGFPNFSGTAAYAADYTVPEAAAGKRVFLDAGRVGGVLEVEINGRTAGVRCWPPYRLEITNYVQPGKTALFVLKVTNALADFLEGPDPAHPSGLLDTVHIAYGA